MNYYPHHIGDFIRETSRMNDAQTMAYLRLLWMYYEREAPIPANSETLAFELGTDEATLQMLLKVFFQREGDVWRHRRCDKELAIYHAKADVARENGKRGGRPKGGGKGREENPAGSQKNPLGSDSVPTGMQCGNLTGTEQEPNSNQIATGSKANQEPRTKNQELSLPSGSDEGSSEAKDAPPKSKDKKPQCEPEDIEAARWMFERVKLVAPSAKEPNFDSWGKEFRLMREQDKRTHREILELFRWANADSFWKANILSPSKLREKWTELDAKRRATGGNQARHSPRGDFDKVNYRAGIREDGSF